MEMAGNLDPLAEEDEDIREVDDGDSLSSDDSMEDGDGGIRQAEKNKFDILCDGVGTSLSMVHAAMDEMLELKDELLKHALPPNALMKIALTTTKVYRSISDLHMPVNEMLRLVRIYSTPWEEKSAALKKLHEDYETKKSQLNIAVKRLQLIDAHSKRIERERRIMNWEKLFARLTSSRGHGRRWKFLIQSFKNKAQEGTQALQQYVDSMERDLDSEIDPDEEDDAGEVETQMQQVQDDEDIMTVERLSVPPTADEVSLPSDEQDNEQSESDTVSKDEKDGEEGRSEIESPAAKTRKESVQYIRPPMKEAAAWTEDPEYDRWLYLRFFCPDGIDGEQLRCVTRFGKQKEKTDILDEPTQQPEEDESQKTDEPEEEAVPVKRKGRGRLIGMRATGDGGRPRAAKQGSKDETTSWRKRKLARFSQLSFAMPDEELKGHWKPKSAKREVIPEHLKICVHQGSNEEMVAMATIDMDDLRSLDLPVVMKPPPLGDLCDDEVDNVHQELTASESSITSSVGRKYTDPDAESDTQTDSFVKTDSFIPEHIIQELDPVKFPIYSVQSGAGDSLHMPCGHIPLTGFWVKQLRPRTFNRATDPAESIIDIVHDVTGFDMKTVTKEDLHPIQADQCISPMSITPEPVQDTVPREEYDRLYQEHEEELSVIQQEYEARLQDLADSLQQMQEGALIAPPGVMSPRLLSADSMPRSCPSSRGDRDVYRGMRYQGPKPPNIKISTEQQTKQRKRLGQTLPNWGENLPKDFFERLRQFEEDSRQHKEEFAKRTQQETSDVLEKRLAGEFKLQPPGSEDDMSRALRDVSLPAVFMPTKTSKRIQIFNPRAAKYFHPTGSTGTRLTQPPSMLQLPPLPKQKLSVVNMFELSGNFNHGGNDWLMQRYLTQDGSMLNGEDTFTQSPMTPPPTHTTPAVYTNGAELVPTRESTMLHQMAAPIPEAVIE